MRALVYERGQNLKLTSVPSPTIKRDDEVLIKVKSTGICGTDILILGGVYPTKPSLIIGHESTGEVLEVGSAVTRFRVGDRVVLDPTYFCGQCFYCLNDRPNYCVEKANFETGVSHDGTFAEYHVAREAFFHLLPEELDYAEGTLTEPLACALNALRQTRVSTESRVLVVGLGPMGLLFSLALQFMGCEVKAVDIAEYRIQTARNAGIDCEKLNSGDSLESIHPVVGDRFDLIVDTSGQMLNHALPKVDKGGDLLLVGLNYRFEATITPSYLTDNGIRLIGSIDTNRTFDPALQMLRRSPALRQIVTHRFNMEHYQDAFGLLGVNLSDASKRSEVRAAKIVLEP